ncbi:MAG: hypothetical protein K0S23_161 [Fluviicola sp.]|jgi:hypothetical protein|uniref:hypothetical protein n=1 Tax=Fluviicola sp. TaxID=1917219 RepID=UPI002609EA9F|nr:hypothetical protein [Fluviicola sp.]MDF3025854.1 hypothetical protein [Fluviicola sp.]
MQIKKRFYAAFLVVLLTASSLLIFICLNLLSTNQNNPMVPIPDDAKWVLRLDAETFVKKEIYNTLFAEKDDAFIQKVRELMEKNINTESNKRSLRIDPQEDIVLYSVERNHKSFLLIAVQTKDASAFDNNISDYCKSNQAGAARDNCGLFIQQIKGKKASREELEITARKILSEPFKELKKAAPDKNEFIALNLKKLPVSSGFSSMILSVQHQEKSINLEGEVIYPKKLHPNLKFGLKSTGVYVYSRFIPEGLPDTLLNFLPQGLPHFKDIEAYAIDFKGTYLEDPKDSLPSIIGFLPTPVMNLIVQTKNACDITDLWKAFPQSVRRPNLTLSFGNTVFHLKQLAANAYFIGVDPNAVISHSGNEVFFIKGHLEKSTKVYGSTFVTAFIENMGPVKAFNDFLNSSESINIEIKPKRGDRYAISGQINFKKGKLPLHEMTKMVSGMPFFAE